MTASLLNCSSEVKKKKHVFHIENPKIFRYHDFQLEIHQKTTWNIISVVMYIDHDMDLSENIWYIMILQENGIFNTWKLNNLSRTVFKSTKISEFSCN